MKNYEEINLLQEDAYDDSDYQPYELMEYNCQEEDVEPPSAKREKKTEKDHG